MHDYPLLESVNSPGDLKAIDSCLLPGLCAEIREYLIENISKTGGHLASNLGAVELTVAAHRVFSSPIDSIMFDVGHQCYVHKMLTGRRAAFGTLRRFGGISGFLRPAESEHDCFVSGHASNSISACLGLARAKKLSKKPGRVVCVIGDGALTGGMAYEALNDAGQSGEPLVIIFNDNEMSISRNVGAIAARLSKIRLKPRYLRAKAGTKLLLLRLPFGSKLTGLISTIKQRLRVAILKESLFELLGFRYLGPADGHDIKLVESLLREAAALDAPVVVHLKTVKGKGYFPSEKSPGEYHGVSSFDVVSGTKKSDNMALTFSEAFGQEICKLARENDKICAVTAAMTANTGLEPFSQSFPGRFFDVGIAEEHAVTMAAGLAVGGMTPVCALYSTFLQRGYDQLLHDVSICASHVVFAVDRAGIVGADGVTHQGAFDISYLLSVPGMAVLSPSSILELSTALRQAVSMEGPVAVRYPRGGQGTWQQDSFGQPCAMLECGEDVVIISLGIMINEALAGAEMLKSAGRSACVFKLNRLDDFDFASIEHAARQVGRVVVLEDGILNGGIGQKIAAKLAVSGANPKIKLLNLGNGLVAEGEAKELYSICKIDAQAVFEASMELINE